MTEDQVRKIVKDELESQYINSTLSFIVRYNPKGMIKLAARRPEVEIIQQYGQIAQKAIDARPKGFFGFFRSMLQ